MYAYTQMYTYMYIHVVCNYLGWFQRPARPADLLLESSGADPPVEVEIPLTFPGVHEYCRCFQLPLLQELHEELKLSIIHVYIYIYIYI